MPQRRRCSHVRVLTRLVVGNSTLPPPCSTRIQEMPRHASSLASAKPTGPPPAMSTGVRFEPLSRAFETTESVTVIAPSTKSFLDETEITNLTDRDGKDKREK